MKTVGIVIAILGGLIAANSFRPSEKEKNYAPSVRMQRTVGGACIGGLIVVVGLKIANRKRIDDQKRQP
jgi:hypothetical protein